MNLWLKNTFSKPHLAIVWTLVILGLCSLPSKQMPKDLGWDKLHHFGSFGILGALWYWAKPQPIWVIVGGIAYGFFIEVWQHVLPIGRTFDLYDALSDALGVIVAIPIAHWVKKTFFLAGDSRRSL
jgi:VanZ family protein